MALKLDITKAFVELTDDMIKNAIDEGVSNENCNFTLVKVPLKSTTKIETATDYNNRESYKSGVGRVIITPRLLDPDTDAAPRIGDYVVYSHEAKYTIHQPVVNWIFDMDQEFEEGKEPVINVRDVDIMSILPAFKVHQRIEVDEKDVTLKTVKL